MPAGLVSGEVSLLGLQMAALPPRPHRVESDKDLVSSSSYKYTNPKTGASLMISSKPHHLLKPSPPNTITLGVRDSTFELWWGHKHSLTLGKRLCSKMEEDKKSKKEGINKQRRRNLKR